MMISFENVPKDEMEALCTPMHCILPRLETSGSTPSSSTRHTPIQAALPPTNGSKAPQDPSRRVRGALYLGSMAAAYDHDLLREHHITHLVQVLETPWAPQQDPDDFEQASAPNKLHYHRIDIEDRTTAALGQHLSAACDYVENALADGENVLVHCQQGVSRSASIIIAFLIRQNHMSCDAAYAFVKERRRCIRPNSGFLKALHEWETACNKIRPQLEGRRSLSA
ncbi:Phosphatases II [Mycena kentingensis (nom. inval.)]|nr:Phosphatases II [Mycena kentingensis (nom. inval.)]